MSLILEALRKSEAERQRAQVPGLHAPVPQRPVRRAAPAWGPWVAVVVGAALLGGTWWVNRPTPVAPPPHAHEAPPRQVATTPPPTPVAATPAPVATAPAPRVPDPPRVEPQPTPLGDPVVEPPPAPAPKAPEPVATPDPVPPPATTAPAESLPTLASLSPTDREALPPLKVSMFVWSPEPARRFAIVDGNRVGEGALLAGGTVVEIRPDGVVLELQGRRVLLARP